MRFNNLETSTRQGLAPSFDHTIFLDRQRFFFQYGTRHIVETLENFGYKDIQSILICGGLNKNPLFTQTQANVGNLPVVCPEEPESVLLGSAMLGACAAKYFKVKTFF